MIKGLIGLKNISRDLAVGGLMLYILIWAIKELNKELNPAKLINEAEVRQVAYVDKTVSRMEKRLERIEDKIDRLSPKGLATIHTDVNNNKN